MSQILTSKEKSDNKDNSSLFNLLNTSELELIEQNHQDVIFNPGETILKKGTPGTHVLAFNKGLAKFYLEGKERNIIIRLIKPGELLSAPGSMDKTMLPFSVAAVEQTSIGFIESKIFRQVMGSNLVFKEQFLGTIHQNLSQIIEKLVSLNTKNTLGRMAEALLYLSEEVYHDSTFTLTISKTELAELAGISKEAAFRILKELDQDGLISRDEKSITLQKTELLSKISLQR